MSPRFLPAALVGAVLAATALAGCGTSSSTSSSSTGSAGAQVIPVAASTDAWGSILSSLGGSHVKATSIISNPDTDPHAYEPTPADGRTIAGAKLFVENGIGYDSWAAKSLSANPNPDRQVVEVGSVTGTPDDGNPHQWYSPASVDKVADAITAALKKLDPSSASYFDAQRADFDSKTLADYHATINEIKAKYAGTPVGASESIFAPMATALGLNLVTPPSFLKAISEGTDPSAADLATINAQIKDKQIKVYVFNSQNSTPDVSAQVDAAKAAGIPVSAVTETLSPKGASFQDWQTTQLKSLEAALGQATGK
ncbi:metal ABC transporter solute-binding protein, Zn/Mn family [Sinomonas susongensis]|uniref:metal ABC transporter solute-binding protein, Zn/Mn family n=1 Tax=Sinomonas susongensis TaxID=1324851 RepID=UPI001109AA9E|nr:zinc ABC transporter substrate-binding protein [Sinomonas susongensis]